MPQTLQDIRSGKLDGATRISLREDLETFPREIFQLSKTLEILDLSDNHLSSLPNDFPQLKKLKILFLSNNAFEEIPRVLRSCHNLEMIALKSNKISSFPEYALPIKTKWLMLTNNQIEQLPESFGELTELRKLALAGNQLTSIPSSIQYCRNLELARFSANRLRNIPNELLDLPKLSWLGVAGNECCSQRKKEQPLTSRFELTDFILNNKIGEGASGVIYLAEWSPGKNIESRYPHYVAVKLFKDRLTSDGYAKDEIECAIQAGAHPHLINILGQIDDSKQVGLVMEKIASEYTNLGHPPNFQTCTRDTFSEEMTLKVENVLEVCFHMSEVLNQMYLNRVSNGDLYAHNIMINPSYKPLFGDFGAATCLDHLSNEQRVKFEQIEVRAFGCLLDDLLGLVEPESGRKLYTLLHDLRVQCLSANHSGRPTFEQLYSNLALI